MPRAQTLFAIVATAWLIIGILMPHAAPTQHITVTFPSHTMFYPLRVPCYGLAVLFAVFAFLYSLPIQFSGTLAHWHFWLTFGSVALAATGFLVFAIVAEKNLASSSFGPLGIAVTLFFA